MANWGGLLLVLASALAMRLVFLSDGPPVFLTTDSITYALPASHLAHGQGFDLSLRRTPGYPLFLAAVWAVFGDDLRPVAYIQHLLGVATSALTWLLGRLVFGRLPALLGGLAVALSGPQIIYEHYLMTESLFTLLLVLSMLALVGALARGSGRLYVLTGLMFGLCALTRPVGQVLPLLVPLAALFGGVPAVRRVGPAARGRLVARATLLALVGFSLVVLPWMARNWLAGGELTGSSALGKTLFGRITRHEDERSTRRDDRLRFDLPPAGLPEMDPRRAEARAIVRQAAREDTSRGSLVHERLVREFGYSEAQAYNVMRDAALEVLLAQPDYWVRSSLHGAFELFLGDEEPLREHLARLANARLRSDWSASGGPELISMLPPPVTEAERQQTLARSSRLVRLYQPSHNLVAPVLGALFLLGALAVLLRPVWRAALPLPLLVIPVLLLSAFLDGPVPRFRYPLDPLLALTAAAGLLALASAPFHLSRAARADSIQAEQARLK